MRIKIRRGSNELGEDRAVGELFKTSDKNGSVFACGYLRKHRDLAALLNNSKVQISTVFVQGSNMFKAILDTLPIRLDFEQINIIVREIDDIEDSCIISKQHGAKLRGIVWSYIEKQYCKDSDKAIQYVSYKRHLTYIKEKYGSNSEEVIKYVTQRKKLVDYIKKQYGSKLEEPVRAVAIEKQFGNEIDEGYESNNELSDGLASSLKKMRLGKSCD